MAQDEKPQAGSAPAALSAGIRRLEFASDTAFQTELRRRVDEFFRASGRRRRDCWQMYLKSAIILAAFGASWWMLVFVARTPAAGLALAVVLGLSIALIGFNIQHDGGHMAYSEHRWVNRIAAGMMGLIGGSSYTWRWKHSVIHHMYVNVTGYDNDIDVQPLGRFSPHQKRRWFHRWQHIYMWAFYGLETVKLQLIDDFRYLIFGRFGPHRVGRPLRWELVNFIVGKAAFACLAFVVPMLFHSVWVVLFYYLVTVWVTGLVMVLVFVLPHLVDDAEFPLPAEPGRMDRPWAVHQASVTVDFARGNRVLTWLLGGLNFHKEHHLFPLICHVNYPAMSAVVQQTCRDFGLAYKEHRSFLAGIASHYRWLRRLARQD
ncbi:MAG: acyl-CoA desaturase [Planctomycetaceae bacterium]|nr:acyl-CoA desaturase [Planctomycetaceae bacterium]